MEFKFIDTNITNNNEQKKKSTTLARLRATSLDLGDTVDSIEQEQM